MGRLHTEKHLVYRIGWLRAAVLGANDGIVSTASLILGVASASTGTTQIVVAGIAGLVAGAMSMAAGEYVSVSSQSDTELADLARERKELETQPGAELNELMQAYIDRGLTPELARQVAIQLTSRNALEAHARDELGIVEHTACASSADLSGHVLDRGRPTLTDGGHRACLHLALRGCYLFLVVSGVSRRHRRQGGRS